MVLDRFKMGKTITYSYGNSADFGKVLARRRRGRFMGVNMGERVHGDTRHNQTHEREVEQREIEAGLRDYRAGRK